VVWTTVRLLQDDRDWGLVLGISGA